MSETYNQLLAMIETVARALGDDLLPDVAFVGGCTTGLLLTDDFTRESVRATDDVDLIVNVMGYGQWYQLKEQLKEKGFSESMEDDVICRLRLGELQDFEYAVQSTARGDQQREEIIFERLEAACQSKGAANL